MTIGLQSMFSPQGYTQQQLDSVLRHFGGHMENCVACILVHGDGSPEDGVDSEIIVYFARRSSGDTESV